MSTPPDSLDERYHSGRMGRRVALLGGTVVVSVANLVALAVGAVIVLAFGGWLAWATLFNANPPVTSSELTHEIVDDHTATITYRIKYGDGPVDAACTARAIAHDKTVVGEVTDRPDPADGVDHTIELSTDRRATTVEWLGCTAPGQPRPR